MASGQKNFGESIKWTDNAPAIYLTVNYGKYRRGADMVYSVSLSVSAVTGSGRSFGYPIYAEIKVNGEGNARFNPTLKGKSPSSWSSPITYSTGDFTVENKTSGSTALSVRLYSGDGSSRNETYTFDMGVDPAYTSITGFNVSSIDETTVRFNWSTADVVNWIQYSTDNGSSWHDYGNPNSSSGYFNVGGLSANSSYNCKINVRRADSGLWTVSSEPAGGSTYAYPSLNDVPMFVVGNQLTVKINNPLGRTCTITAIGDNNDTKSAGTTTGTSMSGFNNSEWLDWWYSTLPSDKNGKYRIRLQCSNGNVNQLSDQVSYSLNTSDANFKPIFDDSNVIDIVNTVNTNISGTTKFIKNHNSLSGVITPMTLQRSASTTGSKYYIESNGLQTVEESYSSSNINFVLGNMNNDTITVTAVDSRGFTQSVTKTIDLIDYNNPEITDYDIHRQNGVGTHAEIEFWGKYTDWSGLTVNNTIENIQYKIGSGSWTNLPSSAVLTASNGNWHLKCILDDTFNIKNQYNLYLQITDKLETITTEAYTISTADAFIWKDLQNKYMGINKKPSYELDIDGDSNLSGDYYVGGQKLVSNTYSTDTNKTYSCDYINNNSGGEPYPVGAIYISADGRTSPASLFGGTWQQLKGRYLYASNVDASSTAPAAGKDNQSTYTGANTQSHTLTANQSGLREHNHSAWSGGAGSHSHSVSSNGYWRTSNSSGNAVLSYDATGSGSWSSNFSVSTEGWHAHDIGVGNNGPWDAAEGHSHNVSYISVYVWQRLS